jgi:hypothetical protein
MTCGITNIILVSAVIIGVAIGIYVLTSRNSNQGVKENMVYLDDYDTKDLYQNRKASEEAEAATVPWPISDTYTTARARVERENRYPGQ